MSIPQETNHNFLEYLQKYWSIIAVIVTVVGSWAIIKHEVDEFKPVKQEVDNMRVELAVITTHLEYTRKTLDEIKETQKLLLSEVRRK